MRCKTCAVIPHASIVKLFLNVVFLYGALTILQQPPLSAPILFSQSHPLPSTSTPLLCSNHFPFPQPIHFDPTPPNPFFFPNPFRSPLLLPFSLTRSLSSFTFPFPFALHQPLSSVSTQPIPFPSTLNFDPYPLHLHQPLLSSQPLPSNLTPPLSS